MDPRYRPRPTGLRLPAFGRRWDASLLVVVPRCAVTGGGGWRYGRPWRPPVHVMLKKRRPPSQPSWVFLVYWHSGHSPGAIAALGAAAPRPAGGPVPTVPAVARVTAAATHARVDTVTTVPVPTAPPSPPTQTTPSYGRTLGYRANIVLHRTRATRTTLSFIRLAGLTRENTSDCTKGVSHAIRPMSDTNLCASRSV